MQLFSFNFILCTEVIIFWYHFFITIIWNVGFDHNLHVGWHLNYFLLLPAPPCLVSLVFLTYTFDCYYFLFIRFLDVELSLLLPLISRRWDLCFPCFFFMFKYVSIFRLVWILKFIDQSKMSTDKGCSHFVSLTTCWRRMLLILYTQMRFEYFEANTDRQSHAEWRPMQYHQWHNLLLFHYLLTYFYLFIYYSNLGISFSLPAVQRILSFFHLQTQADQ